MGLRRYVTGAHLLMDVQRLFQECSENLDPFLRKIRISSSTPKV